MTRLSRPNVLKVQILHSHVSNLLIRLTFRQVRVFVQDLYQGVVHLLSHAVAATDKNHGVLLKDFLSNPPALFPQNVLNVFHVLVAVAGRADVVTVQNSACYECAPLVFK